MYQRDEFTRTVSDIGVTASAMRVMASHLGLGKVIVAYALDAKGHVVLKCDLIDRILAIVASPVALQSLSAEMLEGYVQVLLAADMCAPGQYVYPLIDVTAAYVQVLCPHPYYRSEAGLSMAVCNVIDYFRPIVGPIVATTVDIAADTMRQMIAEMTADVKKKLEALAKPSSNHKR